jgi:hypothetical protein
MAKKYDMFTVFKCGFIMTRDYKRIMDREGNIFTQEDFLKRYGTKSRDYTIADFENKHDFNDGKLRIMKSNALLWNAQKMKYDPNSMGFIDLNSNKIIEGSFCNTPITGYELVFDKVSKLAYAERYLGDNNAGQPILRKGYINEEGVFVLLIGPGSKW